MFLIMRFTRLHLVLLYAYSALVHARPAFSGEEEAQYLKLGPELSRPVAVLIVVLVFVFFVMVFFSVYLRHYVELHASTRATGEGVVAAMCGRQRQGLDPAVIRTFPVVVHSGVKDDHVECAVCLAEFQHHETLRLIPKCGHVFHPSCIDAWLASCATCPLCRAQLETAASESDVVAINVDGADFSREQRLDRDGDCEQVSEADR